MRVTELWRYPVKSMQGERITAVDIGPNGIEGDRRFALFDAKTGLGLTGRRVAGLLFASARTTADGGMQIVLPDGTVLSGADLHSVDAALSEWLGRDVALRRTTDTAGRSFESPLDFENEASSVWRGFDGASGSFRDSEDAVVSIVSEGSLASWDRRRFRANIVVSGSGEDALEGYRVALGSAVLDVTSPLGRCVMVTRPQPGDIDRDLDVLRSIHRERGGTLAIGATVLTGGAVGIGDELLTDSHTPVL